jgi:CDP-glucose 4,6-dehydratase
MSCLLDFYKNKRVFITGHTGFKGSWLLMVLQQSGAIVHGYALPPQGSNSLFNIVSKNLNISSTFSDIRDADNLKSAMNEFKPDIVFHLAAQALVGESYADPVGTYETNIMGSVNLLEAVRSVSSCDALVYITSDKCYHNNEWVWGYRETERLGGVDPYSASKACAELVFSSYFNSFMKGKENFHCASARAGNVIGGGDWAKNRIVPDCVRAIASGDKIDLRMPEATRPWQHVLEPLSGYLLLGKRLCEGDHTMNGEAWNFGPEISDSLSVLGLASVLNDYLGGKGFDTSSATKFGHEAGLLQLTCEKAHSILNWWPTWGVEQSVEETALWYKYWLEKQDMFKVTKVQVERFFNEFKN